MGTHPTVFRVPLLASVALTLTFVTPLIPIRSDRIWSLPPQYGNNLGPAPWVPKSKLVWKVSSGRQENSEVTRESELDEGEKDSSIHSR